MCGRFELRRCARVVALMATLTLSASAFANTELPSASISAATAARLSEAMGRDDGSYRAHARGPRVELNNPEHGFSAVFTREGMNLRAGDVEWRVALTAYGYGNALRKVASTRPQARENRIVYRRGALTEWYINGPAGLEQGFTFSRPPNKRDDSLLTLVLAVAGDVSATTDADRRTLTLWSADREALRYSGLAVNDAEGRELDAWLELDRDRVLIRVDDSTARYPITVDPVVQSATLKAADGDLGFGDSLAQSGDTIVVGSNSGTAYVFVKPAAGWTGVLHEDAKLTASDGFGFVAVAISGDTIVAGAPGATADSNVLEGAAYVFTKPTTGWSGSLHENAKLTPTSYIPATGVGDGFGTSVAVAGDTIVVGKAQGNCCSSQLAKAYVFVEPATGWNGELHESATLGNAQENDDFVRVIVAISGDANSIFASFHGDIGGAHFLDVFSKPAAGWAGTLQPSATLSHSDGVIPGVFASNEDGSAVVVGTPFDESSADAAAAYVFLRPAAGWSGVRTESAKLFTSAEDAHHQYASAVAINGDTILLGDVPPNECGEQGQCGFQRRVYVYVKPSSGWTGAPTEDQAIAGPATDYYFGGEVAVSGDTVAIGDVDGGFGGPAAVYVAAKVKGDFSLSPIGPMTIATDGSASAAVVVKSITDYLGTFNSPVSLNVTGQPSGITASVNPASATPPANGSATATLALQASAFVTPQTFTLTVTGTSGSLSHSRLLAVTVQATTSGITQVVGAEQALGCIDNAGVANAITSKLAQAQADIDAGDVISARAALADLLALLIAQNGKHIHASCTINNVTFDPDAVLIADVEALLAGL